jgi:hypothetical protein
MHVGGGAGAMNRPVVVYDQLTGATVSVGLGQGQSWGRVRVIELWGLLDIALALALYTPSSQPAHQALESASRACFQVLLKEYWLANNRRVVLDFNAELFTTTHGADGFRNQHGWTDACTARVDEQGLTHSATGAFARCQGLNSCGMHFPRALSRSMSEARAW